jgi:tRNA threonylcarbamoyladenosine biosynthesis protein TsaB
MKKIIAIETTGSIMSIALAENGAVLASYRAVARQHSELVIPVIERLMKEHKWHGKPDGIAVDIGPGSFTGIRIGISVSRALAQAWQIPLYGAVSLDILAQGVVPGENGLVCSAIDALRGEVFTALYQCGTAAQRFSDYELLSITTVIERLYAMKKKVLFVGSGALLHQELIRSHMKSRAYFTDEDKQYPSAEALIHHTDAQTRENAVTCQTIEPFYMRQPPMVERMIISSL